MGLNDTLAAMLADAPVQGTRLVRLHTPLGPDMLLAERLELHECIAPGAPNEPAAGFLATLDALCTDTHLQLKRLIGQPVCIELAGADATSASLRSWHGHVTEAALQGSDGGLARYRLRVEPWLAALAHRQDAWVFQDHSVVDIIDAVFARYHAQGPQQHHLVPAWRWELAEAASYPRRSIAIQYHESDLAFVQRLMREEGLFCWWEHSGAVLDANLGSHTLVIADHNGAFAGADLARVRYTQAGAGLSEDSLVQLSGQAQVATARLEQASWDYRSVDLRPVQQSGGGIPAGLEPLALVDVPGQYAYEDTAQGERLTLRQMQALDARRAQFQASGTLRGAAPGRTLTLVDHPVHDGSDSERDRFVVLAAQHRARSNLRADLKARVLQLDAAIAVQQADAAGLMALPNSADEPVYASDLRLQHLALPVRPAPPALHDLADVRLSPRPTVHGTQSALVVGLSEPVHTDRDHRIKIQFHWQRGANASCRQLPAPADNAPASDASGTWVRVAQSIAGANWGSVFTPRLGQEVLVGFVAGDIDRPVVLGSVYNGQGSPDAQANQLAHGAAGSTASTPAWFPGSRQEGPLQAHQHGAVLSGVKTQELAASGQGGGGSNQFVFDDSPNAARIELASTSAQTRLQLGHLLHQQDNRRLQPRGHGLDLATQAWGAVRAGAGLLVSAHQRPDSARHIDAREPTNQLAQGRELVHALAETAQQHQARLDTEPDVTGASQATPQRQLPVEQGLWASEESLAATDTRGQADAADNTVGGGAGTVSAWARPELVLAAPDGIALHTAAAHTVSAGGTVALAAGQDLQHAAQGQHSQVAKDGLVLFTYGKAANLHKPGAETGIALHAASGNVNAQSLTGAARLTADRAVEVASTQAAVLVSAPQHVLLTAAGAAIQIEGANITLKAPGKVQFRASMKELAGPVSAQASLALKRPGEVKGCAQRQVKGLDAITEF